MIDAHVHIYPSIAEVSAVARAAKERWPLFRRREGRRPSAPALDIERVARIQRRLGRLHPLLESIGSVVLAPTAILGGTTSGLLASMARHGLGQSIVIGSRGVASNEWLLATAQRVGGDRLIPVVTLPLLPSDAPTRDWLDAYEALARAGARGFKIHTNWDGIDASHPAIEAIFEVAKRHDRFVILHTGCFHVVGYESRGVDLASFERWLEAFPDVRVCLAHMNRDRPEVAWDVMRRHANVYADTSWQPAEAISRAIREVGSDRLMLGSDWPLLHADLQGDARERAERAASGKALEDLLFATAMTFIAGRRR